MKIKYFKIKHLQQHLIRQISLNLWIQNKVIQANQMEALQRTWFLNITKLGKNAITVLWEQWIIHGSNCTANVCRCLSVSFTEKN